MRPMYCTKGGSPEWLSTAEQLGYMPHPMPKAGKRTVVSRDVLQTERIDVEITETSHEH